MGEEIYDKLIDSPWHQTLLINTEKIITKEYEKYYPIYNYILDFIKKSKYLISNIELLLGENIKWDEPLHIFVLNPHIVSTNLFKELCHKFGKQFVLQTELQDKHYVITNISKSYIRLSYIDQYKGISLINYVGPVKRDNYLVLPPILELIDIYKNIYNPEKANDWNDMINKSQIIKTVADKNINSSILGFIPKKGGKNDSHDKTKLTLLMVNQIMIDMIKEYKDYILIHKYTANSNFNMSIISKNSIQTDFERINNYLKKRGGEFVIIYKNKKLFIGKDKRIQKNILYISFAHSNEFENTQKPFLDIYNNLEYEVVPYFEEDGFNLAHSWVQIRFYYIDIWNLLAAYHLKILNYTKFAEYTNRILNIIKEIKMDWTDMPTKYMGIYKNEYQAFKQIMQKEGKSIRVYC